MEDPTSTIDTLRAAAMRHGFLGATCVILSLAMGWRVTLAGQPGADELVGLVIDAIDRNFSVIKTAEMTVREVLEDASVRAPKVTVTQTPNGGELRVRRTPRNEWQKRILLKGDKLRVDTIDNWRGEPRVTETWALAEGVWTQYIPHRSAAWVRRINEMPGMSPMDPRQVGSNDVRRSIREILRQDAILSAKLTTSADGNDRIQIVAKPAQGTPTSYEFSADQDFLPTRLETRWPDGSLLQQVDYEYRDVLDGRTKFLEKVTNSFFAQGATRRPKASGWRQRHVRELTSDVVINQTVAEDAFKVQFQLDTRVSDNTRHAVYMSRVPVSARRLPWSWYGAGILGCVTLLVSLRTYRRSTA